MPRRSSLYTSPLPSTPRRQPPRLGMALHSPSHTPRRQPSSTAHPGTKPATPRHGTPRLGVEPDLQHVLPTPRPRFGVCTTHNPTQIPRNHPQPITYTLTH
ncbi:hypothetical protein PIB30_073774 [Stylosanthes scabra]|uniref:Uncharacterized protein n=1 Tax=Stylosanthes scabra TaxID=79078 RepID=A0ABU6VMX1_9FABA|nr:hypothetical protein [Stylosanthes scabra]